MAGFPIKEQTWEPEANIFNETLIEAYFNKQNIFPQNMNACVIIVKPEMVKTNQRSVWHNLRNSWKQFRLWLLSFYLLLSMLFI